MQIFDGATGRLRQETRTADPVSQTKRAGAEDGAKRSPIRGLPPSPWDQYVGNPLDGSSQTGLDHARLRSRPRFSQ